MTTFQNQPPNEVLQELAVGKFKGEDVLSVCKRTLNPEHPILKYQLANNVQHSTSNYYTVIHRCYRN
ncbi:hypothetical protein GBAR_LOCUS23775 [Geodia barretti]|uniref:Uncharacterized protein n=1 Tax=Geodia barretti TaxID=519541 RepID=A0AA35T8R5_GEOBA|nr:hypothetical protein GBAR_LOCUS23775 [Geodia barretti]